MSIAASRDPAHRHAATWPWTLALAAPFVLFQAILLATGRTLPVFWGGDEAAVHWVLSLRFARELPHFNPIYPLSATAPFFQLLGAFMVRTFGPHLTLARLLNTAFSFAGVLALFGILRRSLRHGTATAALLSAVYLTSCYFFGYSFRWLTDNLALTLCILAVGQLFRFADPTEPRRLRAFLIGCGWCALLIFTRQNYLFVWLPFGWTLLTSDLTPRAKAIGLAGLALAVVPFGWLVLEWHGVVPPALQSRHVTALAHLYPLALPLMLLGFYTPFFVEPQLWWSLRSIPPHRLTLPAAAMVVGLVTVWTFPLVPIAGRPDLCTYFPPLARTDIPGYFAGWLYTVAAHLPKLHGNSLLFWGLLPTGLASAACFGREALFGALPARRVQGLFLTGVLLFSTLNIVSSQKYYDALVLLSLVWYARVEVTRDPWRRIALGGLILLFCAYQVAFPFTSSEGSPHPPAPISQDTTAP